MRVVTVRSSHDDDDLHLAAEFFESELTILSRLTDGVDETHVTVREARLDESHEMGYAVCGLGGLRDHTESLMRRERGDVLRVDDDVRLREIAGEAEHFHVVALADHDGVVALQHKLGQGSVGLAHQGTGGIRDSETLGFPCHAIALGGAVSGDDDLGCGGVPVVSEVTLTDSHLVELCANDLVVNELSEDGGGSLSGSFVSGLEGVTHAKAHAVVFREDDIHEMR